MKNKLIIITVCITLIILSFFLSNYEKTLEKDRYHEHLEQEILYPNYNYQNITEQTLNSKNITENNMTSHLPILKFDTKGQKILGGESKQDKDYITATLSVYDAKSGMIQMKKETFQTESQIRYRGNSSRFFEKKGLRLKLINDKGKDNDYPLLGLTEDHDYVLHGPYLDKSLLRNYIGYNITGEIMEYSPNVRYCEVFINQEYQGVYLLVENVKVAQNRVNISEVSKEDHISSYLLEVTHKYPTDDELYFLDNFTFYSNRMKSKSAYKIQYPTTSKLTEELKQYIEKDVSEFEKKLYSYDYDDENHGYMNDIDIDTFVNYVVLNEFFLNYDAGYNSTYIYKDKTGKFKIVFWDMNNIFNNYFVDVLEEQDFYFQDRPWFQMLLKDEYFVNRVIDRYRKLRETLLKEEYLYEYIDQTIDYLGPAIERNFVKWGDTFTDLKNRYTDPTRNPHSYKEAIKQLKKTIHERGTWLDKNIESLKQFAHESKVKEFNP